MILQEGAKGFICLRSSCGHRVSAPEVSRRLQEIKADLEKAVDLMERERPGGWEMLHPDADAEGRFINASFSFVQKVFFNIPMVHSCSSLR